MKNVIFKKKKSVLYAFIVASGLRLLRLTATLFFFFFFYFYNWKIIVALLQAEGLGKLLQQMNNISKLLTKYNRGGMHFNVFNFVGLWSWHSNNMGF